MNAGAADQAAEPEAIGWPKVQAAANLENAYRASVEAYDEATKALAAAKIAEIKVWELLVRVAPHFTSGPANVDAALG